MPSAAKDKHASTVSANWSNYLDQVRRDYETEPARGLAHGLQKDAIQNGWGARVGDREWNFEFALHHGPSGRLLLTMTDAGTTGLIGQVFDYAKDLPPEFPEKEKLARFECMFDSGGGIGPGLFGRGKLLFNAASQQQMIFYDSYTLDKQYRLGRRQIKGRNCDQLKRVLEAESARKFLKEWTGNELSPLDRPGTRITIVDPISEIVSAIHDGSFLKAIEETWWEIIKKHDAKIVVTDEKGKSTQARIPEEFHSLPQRNVDGWRVYYRQNEAVEIGDSKFRIKHLHFLLPPGGQSLPLPLLGVSVYRRGMKIGPLQLSDIPPEINERFFGYVQLMPDFENLVAEAENTTHYGFGSLRKPAIRSLRKTVQDHLDLFMQELGYRKAGG